ncbi:MAG: integrase core domain-containing protein, partial [Patescibacteria group bacterium]
IVPRKFRRWVSPKTVYTRVAWNKILPSEKDAILQARWDKHLLDKPVSHIFVHGHNSGDFHVSMATCYRVLNSEHLIRKIVRHRKKSPYISAHSLLKEGFSLLCYDATRFVTDSGVAVWAMPVILLPCRYLLHIGYSLNGVSSSDLIKSVDEAYLQIPESVLSVLVAHSDRGSAMKSNRTKRHIKNLLNAPVHFGRPHTPDDEPWIESFNRTLKYHRDIPSHFSQVDDVVQWLKIFPDIYNNDPHSSLSYVTPLQTLQGKKEVILSRRKSNLLQARNLRLLKYKTANSKNLTYVKKVTTITISTST